MGIEPTRTGHQTIDIRRFAKRTCLRAICVRISEITMDNVGLPETSIPFPTVFRRRSTPCRLWRLSALGTPKPGSNPTAKWFGARERLAGQ